mgnify:CR=1 FL=1
MIWKSKKGKKKKKIKEKIYYISLFAVTLLLLFIAGAVFKLNKRVIVPVVSKVFTDKDDTTVEMNGSQNAISVVLNDPKFNGGSSNDDNSSADDNSGNNGGTTTPPNTNIDTADVMAVKKAIYQFLKGMGFDDYMAAGIMGNVKVESSGFVVGITQGSTHNNSTNEQCVARGCIADPNQGGNAHGLCQWDTSRRVGLITTAINDGKEWSDFSFQLYYWKKELEGSENDTYTSVLNSEGYQSSYDKVEFYTWLYGRKFERPGKTDRNSDYYAFERRNIMNGWDGRYDAAKKCWEEIQSGAYNG